MKVTAWVAFFVVLGSIAAVGLHSSPQPVGKSLTLQLGADVEMELVGIPAGEFVIGESHVNRGSIGFFAPHELLARQVRLTKPFYIGKYEVTVAQFRRFVQATGFLTDAETGSRPWKNLQKGAYTIVGNSWGPKTDASWQNPGFPQDGTHPVTCISWYDAVAFCEWLSHQTKHVCRLPTEAELEYAQRANTLTRYYWGILPDAHGVWANVADPNGLEDKDIFFEKEVSMKHPLPAGRNDKYRYTAPVGSFPPNPFGLYDAIGNAWEYTLDWEGADPARVDPRGADSETLRGMRGGSWMSTPDFYRPSFRAEIEREGRTSSRGMRIVVEQ